jgi:hypothetical protein
MGNKRTGPDPTTTPTDDDRKAEAAKYNKMMREQYELGKKIASLGGPKDLFRMEDTPYKPKKKK